MVRRETRPAPPVGEHRSGFHFALFTAMFESLQEGLSSALRSMAGKAKLSEANMREGLDAVRQALLEADVSYQVAQDFVARVGEQALGEKVLKSLNPSQQVIGIVHQELVN